MTQTVLNKALAVAEACADAARRTVIPHFRTSLQADAKSDDSPVTVADRAAEKVMRSILEEALPDHAILGEESGMSGHEGDWLWVLDPIDGTRAFLTGRPTFGTLISLFHNGRPVLGLIDQPLTGERWIGVKGQKTRFVSDRLPGKIGTRLCPGLKEAELSCTSPEIMTPTHTPRFTNLQKHVRRTSWGGDCYAYGLLALGQIDVIAECTMNPWDWGALVPVIEGAGGSITDWQGQPLRLDSDGTVLACGNPALLTEIVSHLSHP
ncbi:inositol-1-monophosphatase/3'(2'),5'-bisphosphate nucleotidase [Gluconobacter thailandicus F149-1 = NBRC 100600]|nr:inositol monophosphatase family protein [Gluconobacter thailandicus]KXV53263.1 histidinol phosphate phosphatase [Gluconobacter thailandicus]GAN91877.1 inositol-1-monophosphatase/3'(2'),5'-bisphosphate nucleotidase [Gluconobacter thailandicus F149-1 = NBRC 100600]GBR59212.1 inositol monophosphatase [Gluconobacter thailandicus F149-1 = NBRC 100600]GEL86342.1 histidinol-phosphatase [Gluconobacter thailandicus F149-1 = NBRC 100600]